MNRNLHAKPYLYITRRQRTGLYFMVGGIFLFIVLFIGLHLFIQPTLSSDPTFKDEIETHQGAALPESETRYTNLFPFDPNNIGKEQMLQLGLTSHQADMIIKYREAGGQFFNKEDFGKIYAISKSEYELLKPYIIISQEMHQRPERRRAEQFVLVPFDPNSADSAQLLALGLSSYQTGNILKYRRAGGIFTIKKDFSKMYGMDVNTYQELEKYILLPSTRTELPQEIKTYDRQELVEINSASLMELQKLKGIGEVSAQRIAKYREKLGGFYDKSQLLEVYGIDTSRFAALAPQVVVDKSSIRRININEASFDKFMEHPYLEFYIVKEIFNYRDAIGNFDSVAQLKDISLIYDQLYLKIAPYLTVAKKKDMP